MSSVPHPLVAWLEANEVSVPQFAADNGMAFRSVYNQIDRCVKMGSLRIMRKIETGTDGEVTVRDQISWFEQEPEGAKE